jgi:hypothetical protein
MRFETTGKRFIIYLGRNGCCSNLGSFVDQNTKRKPLIKNIIHELKLLKNSLIEDVLEC